MKSDGGPYGRWGVPGIASYAVGFVAMIPFFSTPIFTGPVANALHGADIAFAVGLLVSTTVYLLLMRNYNALEERKVVSRAELNTLGESISVVTQEHVQGTSSEVEFS